MRPTSSFLADAPNLSGFISRPRNKRRRLFYALGFLGDAGMGCCAMYWGRARRNFGVFGRELANSVISSPKVSRCSLLLCCPSHCGVAAVENIDGDS